MTATVAAPTSTRLHPSAVDTERLDWRRELAWSALTMALTTVAVVWTLRLWRGDLYVPFSYENDGQFYAVLVKEVIHGWYFTNSRLGAPFGSQLLDFPQGGDQLNFVLIKVLGLFTSNWALVMNLFFLASFPLVSLSSYAVMRSVGVSRPATTVCSALFALLPYHFWQGEFHLLLSAYYAVPLGAWLVLATYRGDRLFARRPRAGRPVLAWASRRSLVTLGLCCVVASANLYYAAFTVALLAIAVVVAAMMRRSLATVAGGAIAAVAIVAVLALNLSPTFAYSAIHGSDSAAFLRTPAQSRAGSLAIGDLVLPLSDHRIAAFARLRRGYSGPLTAPEVASSEGESSTLGLLATVSLAGVLVAALVMGVARLARRRSPPRPRLLAIALGAGSSLLLATVGGRVIAQLISPDIRQWTRLSVFIGFFALLAAALALDRGGAWIARRRRVGGAVAGVALAVIGALAFLDQTSSEFIPPYRQLAYHFGSDQAFVSAIAHRLAPGSAVFQLPYMPWPEPGFEHRMTSFTPARGYLHSNDLRWSYGAMRGRPADWQAQLVGYPASVVAPAAAAAGFDGIYIDRFGYTTSAERGLEAALTAILGGRPLVSPDGRLVFLGARPYAARLRRAIGPRRWSALRLATLYPLWLRAGAGTMLPPPRNFPTSGVGIHGPLRVRGSGTLSVVNPSRFSRPALFTAQLSSVGGTVAGTVRFPDGLQRRFVAGGRATVICQRLAVADGAAIVLRTSGAGTVRLDRVQLVDAAFLPFLKPGQDCPPPRS